MRRRRVDPLADAPRLIRRVYGYVAFRIGPGPDAEDATSEVFERALRYRDSFDPDKGTTTAWLLGIAQRTIDDTLRRRAASAVVDAADVDPGVHDADTVARIHLQGALAQLPDRDRDLLGLRYGVGLSTKELAAALDLKPGTVDVALHRARARLSEILGPAEREPAVRPRDIQDADHVGPVVDDAHVPGRADLPARRTRPGSHQPRLRINEPPRNPTPAPEEP
jgi:RNA polymerase sigma factor (sigma-70 family)